MNRPAFVTGLMLVILGSAVFLWKAVALDLPVAPTAGTNLWRVEVAVDVRGVGQRGSVSVALPTSNSRQGVLDTHVGPGRLEYAVQEIDAPDTSEFYGRQRFGVFSGRVDGVHHLTLGFRADLSEQKVELPLEPAGRAPADKLRAYGRADAGLPADDAELRRFLEDRRLPSANDPAGRLRMLAGFVTDQIGTAASGSDDPLLTLASREGTEVGKARLLVTMLRAAEVPARLAVGLMLAPGETPEPVPFAEAWIDDQWVPVSPTGRFFATLPRNLVVMGVGAVEPVRTTGVSAVGVRFDSLRERLTSAELDALMVPASGWLRAISLHQLPVSTQKALRVLLILPLGVLIVALFRNLIGVSTFGTFMPVLVAIALRGTSLQIGLGLIAFVIALGIVGRLLLERLRLLMVPRLSVLLCMVVLLAAALALFGGELGTTDFTTAVYFPIVILTMLVERFSVTLAEEGLRESLVRAGWSVAIAMCVYPIFRSEHAVHLMFGFPELVLVVMGVLIWIGAYTGYRASDLRRFRAIVNAPPAAGEPR